MYVYPSIHMYLMYGVFIRTNSAKPLSSSHAVGSVGAASATIGCSLRNFMVDLNLMGFFGDEYLVLVVIADYCLPNLVDVVMMEW
jgi:hypothetical protein